MDIDWRRIFRIRDDYGRINVLFLAVVGLLAVILLIVVVSLTAINQQNRQYDKNMTYVDNVSAYASYMDFAAREEMYMALNSALRENGVKNPPYFGGLIREGTYEQRVLAPNQYASRFVVDVAEVQQSYDVYLVWGAIESVAEFENYVMLRCVKDEQKIYKDFNCQEPTPLNPEQAAKAENYLPYMKYDEDGAAFTATLGDDETIILGLWTCDDAELAKKYEQLGREWIEQETKIDLGRYKIETQSLCDGAAI